VLKCLRNPTFDCFKRNYSPLPKFESHFQKKKKVRVQVSDNLRCPKVPDPELRKRLRVAIIERVVSGFTNYLEDNNRITLGVTVTPRELEEMLQELFEG